MDKLELRQTLEKQAATRKEDVTKKLEYLSGENVFLDDENTEYLDDDTSLEDAFNEQLEAETFGQTQVERHAEQMAVSHPQLNVPNDETMTETIETHKQSLAAKIAALRGISLPGEYLNKK